MSIYNTIFGSNQNYIIMKNFIFLLACLLACSTLANAQLKVDSVEYTILTQNALPTSALDRLVGIKDVSYTEESNAVQSARMSGNGSSVSENKRL